MLVLKPKQTYNSFFNLNPFLPLAASSTACPMHTFSLHLESLHDSCCQLKDVAVASFKVELLKTDLG